jgi:hypothetical protein
LLMVSTFHSVVEWGAAEQPRDARKPYSVKVERLAWVAGTILPVCVSTASIVSLNALLNVFNLLSRARSTCAWRAASPR